MNYAVDRKGPEPDQHSTLAAFTELLARLCARKHWQDSIKREPRVRNEDHDAVNVKNSLPPVRKHNGPD